MMTRITVPKNAPRRLLVNGSTEGDFPTFADTLTAFASVDESVDPSANYAVIDPCSAGALCLQFFGSDAGNETFSARVWGVKEHYATGGVTTYMPYPLMTLNVTLGTATGVAGGMNVAADKYADTIEVSEGFTNYILYSPADNTKATLQLGLNGEDQIIVAFDSTGSASSNGMYWLS